MRLLRLAALAAVASCAYAATHIVDALLMNDGTTAMSGKIYVVGPTGHPTQASTTQTVTIGAGGAVDFTLLGCNGCTYRATYQLTNARGVVYLSFSETWAVPDTVSTLTRAKILDGSASPYGLVNPQRISGGGLTAGQIWIWDGNAWVAGAPGSGAVSSVAGRTGAVALTKTDVGLGNVDNTSDANKPVSTAQASAIAAAQAAAQAASLPLHGKADTAGAADTATTATSATNLGGGSAGQYPYQTGAGATAFRTPNAANGPLVLDASGNAVIGTTSIDGTGSVSGTGAVARSVESKQKDRISVMDYGCVGNGTADDTACVQAAINAAQGGGEVWWPKGIRTAITQVTVATGSLALRGPGKQLYNSSSRAGLVALDTNKVDYKALGTFTNCVVSGTTITCNFSSPHSLKPGYVLTFSGSGTAALNNTLTVQTVPTTTSVTLTNLFSVANGTYTDPASVVYVPPMITAAASGAYVTVEGLVINGNNKAYVAMWLDSTKNWVIRDNYFQGFNSGGKVIGGGSDLFVEITHNTFSINGISWDFQNAWATTSTYYGCNVCWFRDNEINTRGGMRTSGITHITGNNIGGAVDISDANGVIDVSDSFTFHATVSDNYFEMTTGTRTSNINGIYGSPGTFDIRGNTMNGGDFSSDKKSALSGSVAVASNVGTFTLTGTNHSVRVGGTFVVTGSATTALNGTWTVTATSTSGGNTLVTIATSGVANGSYSDMTTLVYHNWPGSIAVNLAQNSSSGYVYGLTLENNAFAQWDYAIDRSSATSASPSQKIGQNTFQLIFTSNFKTALTYTNMAAAISGKAALSVNTGRQFAWLNGGTVGSTVQYSSGTAIDVSLGDAFVLTHSSPTTISTVSGITTGARQFFTLHATTGNITLSNATFHLASGADYTMQAGQILLFQTDYIGVVRQVTVSTPTLVTTAGAVSWYMQSYCQGTIGAGAAGVNYILVPGGNSSGVGCGITQAAEIRMPAACTASALYVTASVGSAVGGGGAVTLYKNGVAQSLTCTLGTGTTCQDTTHSVAFVAGDGWSVRVTTGQTSDTIANVRAAMSCTLN